ncbi:hypothetical protein CYMTET_53331 [Cymbomonas tetramitiformis]|uniref:Uncharacterized protein n=1 Tax=Cymbomonas tetramitiformis TaxID=36881 RepID=A0AAE0BIC6_9CHLO|nr:hypothetical protein CYMTET_53331 [Cymbomonas tetramitiformis]
MQAKLNAKADKAKLKSEAKSKAKAEAKEAKERKIQDKMTRAARSDSHILVNNGDDSDLESSDSEDEEDKMLQAYHAELEKRRKEYRMQQLRAKLSKSVSQRIHLAAFTRADVGGEEVKAKAEREVEEDEEDAYEKDEYGEEDVDEETDGEDAVHAE